MRDIVLLAFLLAFGLGGVAKSSEFSSVDEASMVIAGGNTELETLFFSSKNDYKWFEKNQVSLSGRYTYGESNKIRSAERWDVIGRYERTITEKFSGYAGEQIEANRFSGIDRRYNTDLGGKYKFINNDKHQTFGELGYRYTIEKRVDPSQKELKDSKGRAFAETKHQLNDNVKINFWIEYLPNFDESEDYLINFEPSLAVTLTNIFSLKLGFLWNYDNLPAANRGKHDYTYTTGLIANF